MEMWVADAITNMFADATSSQWQAGQCYPVSGPPQLILTATDVRNVKPVDASYAWSLSGQGQKDVPMTITGGCMCRAVPLTLIPRNGVESV